MTPEEREKNLAVLAEVRKQIDALHAEAFTAFVKAVHNLALELTPIVQGQEALAFKLIEVENLLRKEVMEDDTAL